MHRTHVDDWVRAQTFSQLHLRQIERTVRSHESYFNLMADRGALEIPDARRDTVHHSQLGGPLLWFCQNSTQWILARGGHSHAHRVQVRGDSCLTNRGLCGHHGQHLLEGSDLEDGVQNITRPRLWHHFPDSLPFYRAVSFLVRSIPRSIHACMLLEWAMLDRSQNEQMASVAHRKLLPLPLQKDAQTGPALA